MSSEELKPCSEPQAHPERCGCQPDAFQIARHSKRLVEQQRERIAALEAENARLERLVSHWQGLAVTNRKVADDALAQLAAIQGGMGEVVEVVGWRIGFPNGAGYKLYEQRQPWAYEEYGPVSYEVQDLMTVAQHQRITAAMAAEVERLSRMLNNATNDGIKLADERDALRAELERMDREAGETIGALVKQRDDARAELAAYKALSPYRIRRMKAVTKERDALAAELAAIKASVAALDRNAAFKACPDTGCDWSSFYRGWKAAIKAFHAEQQKVEK